ncbi:hypothetical protein [Deinococcus hopiensis]|uniref:hypothetical protein n=1 Tax=Deinococcus hopiensis TaxID=309885 RepID=UPI00111BEB23|nr:hypothetical protein [Deinococcus hopiensis]
MDFVTRLNVRAEHFGVRAVNQFVFNCGENDDLVLEDVGFAVLITVQKQRTDVLVVAAKLVGAVKQVKYTVVDL